MNVLVRRVSEGELPVASAILEEAALWLKEEGLPLWSPEEISVEGLRRDPTPGEYVLAEVAGQPAGTLKFQLDDPEFWPDVPAGESTFVHRLAVRRKYAGGTVSHALLRWAVDRTRALERTFLRLDCEADRESLRRFYDGFGFRFHSEIRVQGLHLARYELPVSESGNRRSPRMDRPHP